MAPVVQELKRYEDEIETIVCVTAQHREMLDQVLEVFELTPDYDLDICRGGQALSEITAKVLMGMEEILIKERPDVVLVHGDTTTALAAGMAAFYQQVKIGHIEAGLRTFDTKSPFPEEMNRQTIDVIADFLYAPTKKAKENLAGTRNQRQRIFVTGNTAIDAMQTTIKADYSHPVLEWAKKDGGRPILLTAHRRENLGEPMRRIFHGIRRILEKYPEAKLIYPVHLNPKVQEVAEEVFGDSKQVKLIQPLDVLDFHNFMAQVELILSDSGGVQEEAPSLGKPVLVLRDTTERPEGVEAGTLKLVGTEEDGVFEAADELLSDRNAYEKMAQTANPYGDGKASQRIVGSLLGVLGE